MARRVNAVLAINGDYSGTDFGNKDDTFILRQGTVFRDSASEDLDTILRSVGTYASSPEGENDDGAYDA